MASILIGTITALLIILACGVCFYCGYKVGYTFQPKPTEEKTKAETSEEQSKRAEGIANILNYTNRHRVGDGK